MSQTFVVPTKLNVYLDIDLLKGRKNINFRVVTIEKMTEDNFTRLMPLSQNWENFDKAVVQYYCDLCKTPCGKGNPIYTNNQFQGVDVCTNCITKAFGSLINPISIITETTFDVYEFDYPNANDTPGPHGWQMEPLYSLNNITYLNGKLSHDEKQKIYNDGLSIHYVFHVLRDVNLVPYRVFDASICKIEKMTENNYQKITKKDHYPYYETLADYQCLVCNEKCTPKNPIYSNSEDHGVDICTKCIMKAYRSLKPIGLKTKKYDPIYSLKEICEANGKTLDTETLIDVKNVTL